MDDAEARMHAAARSEGSLERRLDSAALFAGGRQVIIVHHGQEYRLQVTKAGKLILTK